MLFLHIFLESIYKNPKYVNVILDWNSKNIGNFEPKKSKIFVQSYFIFRNSGVSCHKKLNSITNHDRQSKYCACIKQQLFFCPKQKLYC